MDIFLPFMLDNGFSKGAYIAADKTIADMVATRHYPPVVEHVFGQMTLLALALSGNIKYNGTFALNVRGDGPIRRIFVSVTHDKKIRGYADFDTDTLPTTDCPTNTDLFGKGQLLFSVSQVGQEPYQGVIQLTQNTLTETVLDYFRLSEQIKTDLVLRCHNHQYRCLMLQEMPRQNTLSVEEQNDLWETQTVLMNSIQDKELFDNTLTPQDILYRLFHANELVVFKESTPEFSCPCHRSQMEKFLKSLSEQERQDLYQDNKITVECQFCGNQFVFNKEDF